MQCNKIIVTKANLTRTLLPKHVAYWQITLGIRAEIWH